MKWLADNLVAILAFFSLLFALWQSHRAAKLSRNLDRSTTLSEIYERIRPGRLAMQAIWDRWEEHKKNLASAADCEKFATYYNAGFHNAVVFSKERDLSNQIHLFMHELHLLADRIVRDEFDSEQVLQHFGHAIAMDRQLIMMFLNAHWEDHGELEKPLKARFYRNVPGLIEDAVKWDSTARIPNNKANALGRQKAPFLCRSPFRRR